jgi:hypothetical protein
MPERLNFFWRLLAAANENQSLRHSNSFAEDRLRFAYRVAKTLEKHDAAVVQAWLTGLNPELEDRVPMRLLREGDLEKVGPEILGAVRAIRGRRPQAAG